MNTKTKKEIAKIVCTIILLVIAIFILDKSWPEPAMFIVYLVIYFIISTSIIRKVFQNLQKGKIFDENFLMLIASIGAFFIGEYHEGIAVILLYQIGEVFEGIAVERSKKSINGLLDLQNVEVHVLDGQKLVAAKPEEVKIGTTIVVKTGERVPLDAVLLDDEAELDVSSLTGESMPINVQAGAEIASGSVNLGSQMKLKTNAAYENSTMTKMMKLVEEATSKKSSSEQFITKFAKYYTPIVIVAAVCLAVIPLFITGFASWDVWLYRALMFLVISCPCALVISIPLSFFAGIGGLSRKGILVKGNEYIESLTKVGAAVFDKTGTLTTGHFAVTKIYTKTMTDEELLQLVASVEQYSTHPIAQSIVQANQSEMLDVEDMQEIAGHGLQAKYQGQEILVGNGKLLADHGIEVPIFADRVGTFIYVALNKEYVGCVVITDPIKDDAKAAMLELSKMNIQRYMVTGDTKVVADDVSQKLHLDGAYSQMLPIDKVNVVEQIIQKTTPKKTLFAGDGLNDAPVIARADIGFAMGGVGSDISIAAADVVIMDDKPTKIALAITSAKRILAIVKQNIAFALFIKFSFLILAAFGLITMDWAIFADVGVTIIAILNAMRGLKL